MNIEKGKQQAEMILAVLEEELLPNLNNVGYLRIVRSFLHAQHIETGDPMFVVGANAVARLILEIDLQTILGGSIYRSQARDVRACNNFEGLLAACKRLLREGFRESDTMTWAQHIIRQAEAAIAAAEKE